MTPYELGTLTAKEADYFPDLIDKPHYSLANDLGENFNRSFTGRRPDFNKFRDNYFGPAQQQYLKDVQTQYGKSETPYIEQMYSDVFNRKNYDPKRSEFDTRKILEDNWHNYMRAHPIYENFKAPAGQGIFESNIDYQSRLGRARSEAAQQAQAQSEAAQQAQVPEKPTTFPVEQTNGSNVSPPVSPNPTTGSASYVDYLKNPYVLGGIGALGLGGYGLYRYLNRNKKKKLQEKGAAVTAYELGMLTAKEAGERGLWDNIHAKRERGEKPAKPGDKDYPDQKSWNATVKASGDAWQRSEGKNPEGGLNAKGRASLKAEGQDIKPPVTEDKPTGERAGRKASFCARMGGMKKKLTSSETANDPDSRINKALRKWNC